MGEKECAVSVCECVRGCSVSCSQCGCSSMEFTVSNLNHIVPK